MEQQVTEESRKISLEKSVVVQKENLPVTFRITAIEAAEETVEYADETFNEDYVNLSPATVMSASISKMILGSPAAVVSALGRAVSSLRTTVLMKCTNLSNNF